MILKPHRVSSSKFTYHQGTFVCEDSDFGKVGLIDRLGQVYDDACDLGFTIVSQKTGREVVFAQDGEDRRDGEVMGWRFVCVTPGHKNLKALIIND
jgi:hypothetical protein